jgi:cytochrome c oxidase subunit 2
METTNYYGWGLPIDVSAHGAIIDQIIIIMHWFMGLLFVGWGIFFIYCLIRFRQRPGHKASAEESHSKLPKFIEVAVVIFEAAVLIGLSYPAWSKLKTNFPSEKESTVVRIVAQQFVWNIHYPGRDGAFGRTDAKLISDSNPLGIDLNDSQAKDDIITVNQLHFPVNKPVIAHLTSKDVIHSFFIPVLRVKQDANPGMVIPIWWEAKQTGQFEIACAQLCGNGHTLMRGFVSIDSPEEFKTWMTEQEASLLPPEPVQPALNEEAPAPEGTPTSQ